MNHSTETSKNSGRQICNFGYTSRGFPNVPENRNHRKILFQSPHEMLGISKRNLFFIELKGSRISPLTSLLNNQISPLNTKYFEILLSTSTSMKTSSVCSVGKVDYFYCFCSPIPNRTEEVFKNVPSSGWLRHFPQFRLRAVVIFLWDSGGSDLRLGDCERRASLAIANRALPSPIPKKHNDCSQSILSSYTVREPKCQTIVCSENS